ncbi:hypothetical protein SDC9_139606 [bioreactor metagenome]|uniref:Phage tail assembly protein n=1 Tax=bioreactor metagenome TaxID=1076179 RepID=A0A645DT24_9ZZZZ
MDTKKKEEIMDTAEALEDTAAEETTAAEGDQEDQEISLVLKFRKPYVFDGKEYTEVDLSGLEDATAKDLEAVGRIMEKKTKGTNPATMEMTMDYAQLLANRITGMPLEFFKNLPAREAMALKTTVVGFLYGGDGAN